MRRHQTIDGYIPALDGFRAIAILMVVWFHLWQQSWLPPVLTIGSLSIDFGRFASTGFIGVELLFLLSGFCLYYPIARKGGKVSWKSFYLKRAIRILPSYWLSVLVMVIFPLTPWTSVWEAVKYAANMFIGVNTFTPEIFANRVNGVLWSLFVELQFYLVAPLIVWGFRKNAYATFVLFFLCAMGYRAYVLLTPNRIGYLMNQLPGMIDLFVGGMLAAHVAVKLRGMRPEDEGFARRRTWIATAVLGASMLGFFIVLGALYELRFDGLQMWQLRLRSLFGIAGMGMMGAAALCLPQVGRAIGNPVSRFVAGISYNMYLWHIWCALQFRLHGFPSFIGDDPHADSVWQWQYMLLGWAVAFAVAWLMTNLWEKQVAKFLQNRLLGGKKRTKSGETMNFS